MVLENLGAGGKMAKILNITKNLILKSLNVVMGVEKRDKLIGLYARLKKPDLYERLECYGELNADKTIYLIRRCVGGGEGLLSIFTYVMGRIDYADRNGLVPFVDVDEVEQGFVFSRYFRLKNMLSRNEVYQSKNVLLTGLDSKPVYPGWCNWINLEFNEQKYELFCKYIEFTEEVQEMAQKAREQIYPERCLGLYLRGTDYLELKPSSHPIQPRLEDVVLHIDTIMSEEKLNRIFLVTEDNSVYEKVKTQYGSMVTVLKDDRFWTEYKEGELIGETIRKSGSIENNNFLYLTKIIMLSECHSFVGGRTNGSSVANALNGGKYKRKFVYDVGYY